jgi:hypothetical protein
VAAFRRLKFRLEGKMALFACDYTPVNYCSYFRELLDGLSLRGLVILSHYSPVLGLLEGGKYDAVKRDMRQGRRDVYDFLKEYLGSPVRAS